MSRNLNERTNTDPRSNNNNSTHVFSSHFNHQLSFTVGSETTAQPKIIDPLNLNIVTSLKLNNFYHLSKKQEQQINANRLEAEQTASRFLRKMKHLRTRPAPCPAKAGESNAAGAATDRCVPSREDSDAQFKPKPKPLSFLQQRMTTFALVPKKQADPGYVRTDGNALEF